MSLHPLLCIQIDVVSLHPLGGAEYSTTSLLIPGMLYTKQHPFLIHVVTVKVRKCTKVYNLLDLKLCFMLVQKCIKEVHVHANN